MLLLPFINMNPPQVYTCFPSWNPLPSPYLYHPSGLCQCTRPKHPVSCIEHGLVIHFIYDIIHVSMPFSQIIPPLPLPQSPKDCFIHLCLFCCFSYRVIVTIFLNSIYMHCCCCCCCCCQVASVMSDSVRPHRWQPTRLPVPGILQARTLEWVAIWGN